MSATMMALAADGIDGRRRSSLAALPVFNKNKPIVDIVLDEKQQNCFVPSFTTLEKIKGTVVVTCPNDVAFDSLHITFQGTVKTFVEKLATSAPTNPKTQAFHTFLRLQQPINPEQYPEGNIAKAGVTYQIPFTFVVPEHLLPQACTHGADNLSITDAHLQLPPSLGDPMMAGDGKSLLDDMAPDNARVSYGIRVFMLKKPQGQNRPTMLIDSLKKIRIIPAVPEAPPLDISPDDTDYVLSSTKSLKKGLLKGKLGTLTVDAIQPPPLYLRNPRSKDTSPITAMATLKLRFEPTDASAKPPRLGSLISRLKVATFYSSIPLRNIPSRASTFHYDTNRGVYVDTLSLAARCVESVQWTKDQTPARHDSAISMIPTTYSTSSDEATGSKKSRKKTHKAAEETSTPLPSYSANVLIPISLPTNKSFVPSFHSCLMSRIYLLDLVLSVRPSASGNTSMSVSSTNFHLKIPIQLASEGNPDAMPIVSEEEAASIARREADEFFVPRSVSVAEQGPDSPSATILAGLPASMARPPASLNNIRGARGSIFTPRWGSLAETGSEDDRVDPPGYTAFGRHGMVIG